MVQTLLLRRFLVGRHWHAHDLRLSQQSTTSHSQLDVRRNIPTSSFKLLKVPKVIFPSFGRLQAHDSRFGESQEFQQLRMTFVRMGGHVKQPLHARQ